MSGYHSLTPQIRVPREWPVAGMEKVIIFLMQDAINCHNLGQRFVMTIGNVPAIITDKGTRPGYVFKRVEEIDDEACRTDLIMPHKLSILKHGPGGPGDREEESTQYLPMNLKFDHPIKKLLVTRADRHTVITVVPDLKKIFALKGITGSKMYDYTIRTTYRIHIKWHNDIVSDIKSIQSTTDFSIIAKHISENTWDILCYDCLLQSEKFWSSLQAAFPWIILLVIFIGLTFVIFLWVYFVQNLPYLYMS